MLNKLLLLLKYSGFISSEVKKPDYKFKPHFNSTHSQTLKIIKKSSNVLDIGCHDGKFMDILKEENNCETLGIDIHNPENRSDIILQDLDKGLSELDFKKYDYICILDVIEHLNSPEKFLSSLFNKVSTTQNIIISTPNIAFFPMRISLLLGNFNYAEQGILDFTHKRLFTFSSLKKIINDNNFHIISAIGVPAPFPFVLGNNLISRILIKVNSILILISKTLFSFQILINVKKNK